MNYTDSRTGLQEQIAAVAARHMAEDGEDAERAKYKAAAAVLGDCRPSGRPGQAHGVLPDNEQLRAALRDHLRRFGGDAHREWLRRQRQLALEWMQRLERFDPYLVGPILDASATQTAHIELDLFADSAKDVEMALLDMGIDFRVDQADGRRRHVQQLIGFVAAASGAPAPRWGPPGTQRGTPILLTVKDPVALRTMTGSRKGLADPDLHPVERSGRADAAMLRRLLDETHSPSEPAAP